MKKSPVAMFGIKAPSQIWHRQLDHLNHQAVKDLEKRRLISCNNKFVVLCESCCIYKVCKFSHQIRSTIYSAPLALVFVNIWGPAPVVTNEGSKYYVNFVDAATNFNWLFSLSEI